MDTLDFLIVIFTKTAYFMLLSLFGAFLIAIFFNLLFF